MNKIRVAIAGIGNCASSLVQGIEYYGSRATENLAGLMHPDIGGWGPGDLEIVAAFDIDRRKVGTPVEQAIFAKPNRAMVFQESLPASGVAVQMGPLLDGVAPHMDDYPDDEAFRVADAEPVSVVEVLRSSRADVFVCYLPVGSEDAVRHYTRACLDAGVAMVNCVPVFIASDPVWAAKFEKAGVPIVGDEFTALPTNHMAVVPELLDDAEAFQPEKDLQKGWFEGNIYGEQFPTEALARICVVVPEDCQDEAFATAFYDSAQAIAIDEAMEGGCPDYDKLETVRTAIALVDAPEAADVDLMQVFPDDICQELIPDQAVVDAQAERTAAAGG